MVINIVRLHQELQASLLINGVCKGWIGPADEPNCSYHIFDGEVIRITWEVSPTTDQKQKASDIIVSHNGSMNLYDKLDEFTLRGRVLVAICFKESLSWKDATDSQKQIVQTIIDEAGKTIASIINSL